MVFSQRRYNRVVKIACTILVGLFLVHVTGILVNPEYSLQEYHSNLKEQILKYTDGIVVENDHFRGGEGFIEIEKDRNEALSSFYESVFKLLKAGTLPMDKKAVYGTNCKLEGNIGHGKDDYKNWYKLTAKELGECLMLSELDTSTLKKGHAEFVNSLERMDMPMNQYKGDGIVTVGGGKFSLLSFLIIKTMRSTGTTLPVEVFIPSGEEGDDEYCNKLLPQLNAKCISLSDVLPQKTVDSFVFKGYQFKALALLASSFKNVLLLDADNFPIKKLDNIFRHEVFSSTGLILWPDFWRRTTSPLFYDITGKEVSSKRVRFSIDDATPPQVYTKNLLDLSDVPLHDLEGSIPEVSTESGQLMIDKEKHLKTVLLALYYNSNGPGWYYPIFSQGASGEGDKETFIAAANFFDLPFYQVRTTPEVDGYHTSGSDPQFRGVSMLQHDFTQDYDRYLLAKKEISAKYLDLASAKYDPSYDYKENYDSKYFTNNLCDIMFIHSHLPKFDPIPLALSQDLIENGHHIRAYRKIPRVTGYDIELENFKVFKEYICENRVHFKYFESAVSSSNEWNKICEYVRDRYEYLTQSHRDALRGIF